MSDLFHEHVPDEFIEAVCRVMFKANWHTYQVLTKRSGRIRDLLNGRLKAAAEATHIWWGVSVENRKHGMPRVDDLRQVPTSISKITIKKIRRNSRPFMASKMSVKKERRGVRRPIERLRSPCIRTGLAQSVKKTRFSGFERRPHTKSWT